MLISSRTPEGLPNRCPICRQEVRLEPSTPLGDAPCPHCGHLLWFVAAQAEVRLFAHSKARMIQERLIDAVTARLGIDKETLSEVGRKKILDGTFLNDLGADSLDKVELIMELEEELIDLCRDDDAA